LNLNSTKFNSKIELKKNEMQIGGEDNENLLMNMMLRKKKNFRFKSEKLKLKLMPLLFD
jgi:hypothetical protein